MAKALYIKVSEDRKVLKNRLRTAKPWERPRLVMLLEMQKAGEQGITKASLMQRVGVCGQSINNWRKAYRQGGLSQLLSHKKTGFKPSVFKDEEKAELGTLANNPKNGIVGTAIQAPMFQFVNVGFYCRMPVFQRFELSTVFQFVFFGVTFSEFGKNNSGYF